MANNFGYGVWGFDGDLRGNEDRLMSRLPIIHLDDERLAVVRKVYWSLSTGEGLKLINSVADATEVGTPIKGAALRIQSGELLLVAGPSFMRDFEVVDNLLYRQLVDSSPRTKDEFILVGLDIAAFEEFCSMIVTAAKLCFDEAVRQFRGEGFPAQANAALRVLRNCALSPLDTQIIRTLAAAHLTKDADKYRHSLRIGSLRLKETEATVQGWVEDYLRDMGESRSTSSASAAVLGLTLDHPPVAVAEWVNWLSSALEHSLPNNQLLVEAVTWLLGVGSKNENRLNALYAAISVLLTRWDPFSLHELEYSRRLMELLTRFHPSEAFGAIVAVLERAIDEIHAGSNDPLLATQLARGALDTISRLSIPRDLQHSESTAREYYSRCLRKAIEIHDLHLQAFERYVDIASADEIMPAIISLLRHDGTTAVQVHNRLRRSYDEQTSALILARTLKELTLRSPTEDRIAKKLYYYVPVLKIRHEQESPERDLEPLHDRLVPRDPKLILKHLMRAKRVLAKLGEG